MSGVARLRQRKTNDCVRSIVRNRVIKNEQKKQATTGFRVRRNRINKSETAEVICRGENLIFTDERRKLSRLTGYGNAKKNEVDWGARQWHVTSRCRSGEFATFRQVSSSHKTGENIFQRFDSLFFLFPFSTNDPDRHYQLCKIFFPTLFSILFPPLPSIPLLSVSAKVITFTGYIFRR